MTSNPNELKLSDLPEDEAIEIFRAFLRGDRIEFLNLNRWTQPVLVRRMLSRENIYRIPSRQDTVPWEHIAEGWDSYSRDACGVAYVHRTSPGGRTPTRWISDIDTRVRADAFAGWKRGTISWRDSFQRRPA